MSPPAFERYLARALNVWMRDTRGPTRTPPHLRQALQHAVFGGGARLRPRLCMAVASAYHAERHPVALASAAAVELLHCASLVHDDLPCFDAALTRRGRPSVQHAFGEPTAVLVGDGLIVSAFGTLARAARHFPRRTARATREIARAATMLVAGQASEACDRLDLATYHRQKTAALFEAAAVCGAIAAGAPRRAWREVGRHIGLAYQLADDISDAATDTTQPNVVRLGQLPEPAARLKSLLDNARAAVPQDARAADAIAHWFDGLTRQLEEVA